MKLNIICLMMFVSILLTACLESENTSSSIAANVNEEEMKQRQLGAFEKASAAPRQFRESLKEDCPHFNSILLTTAETIQLGTRVFNAGGISLTNRIYEGTVYKILFTIKNDCMDLSDALQAGIAMAEEKESYHDKAWALRNSLDLIMGGPPLKPPGG
ncbi:MAG: hypothetical protein ACR2PU_05290 [Gammaproteobacteria bacterium]